MSNTLKPAVVEPHIDTTRVRKLLADIIRLLDEYDEETKQVNQN